MTASRHILPLLNPVLLETIRKLCTTCPEPPAAAECTSWCCVGGGSSDDQPVLAQGGGPAPCASHAISSSVHGGEILEFPLPIWCVVKGTSTSPRQPFCKYMPSLEQMSSGFARNWQAWGGGMIMRYVGGIGGRWIRWVLCWWVASSCLQWALGGNGAFLALTAPSAFSICNKLQVFYYYFLFFFFFFSLKLYLETS